MRTGPSQAEQDRQMSERDEVSSKSSRSSSDELASAGLPLLWTRPRAFLKDLYNEALMAGRHYEQT